MKITLSFIFSVLSVLSVVNLFAADWPHWRGPNLDGISTETGWRSDWRDADPEILWKTNVGIGFSAVAVADNRLFTLGNQDNTETVYAIDATTGNELWSHSYPCALEPKYFEGGPLSTPTVDGDTVYTISREGHLFAFDAASGKIRWQKKIPEDFGLTPPGWGFAGSPLVHGELLLLNAGDGGLALARADGSLRWKSANEECGYSTPFPFERDGRKLALFSTGRDWMTADIATGEELWRHSWLTRYGVNAADPIMLGDKIFLSSGYRKGATLIEMQDGAAPKELWKNKEMHNQMGPCVLIDGHLYGIDGDDTGDTELKCIAYDTGETKWTERMRGGGAVAAAGGQLIVIGGKGELMIAPATPGGFEDTARIQILSGKCWTAPVLANAKIYARNTEGDLVCVDVGK